MASSNDDLEEQIRRNASTQRSFADFAGHRSQVMGLLTAAAAEFRGSGARLVLLGAGNCNDVDLQRLAQDFQHVHLVDWDAAALQRGLALQKLTDDPRLTLHAPVDLSGPGESLPTAHVVASVCLLSQLIESVAKQFSPGSVELASAIISTVRSHLQQLVGLLQPEGIGLLISDFATSQTAPELASATEAEMPAVVSRLLQHGNFFQGLHPGGLYQLLIRDPWFASRISCQIPHSPWNWRVGNRVYAVSALVMRRKIAATGMIEA